MEQKGILSPIPTLNHLLVIDHDSKTDSFIDRLSSHHCLINRYIFTTDGLNALTYLALCKKWNDFPNLILLDLKMQEMDVLEFIERYEAVYYPDFKDTRIVVTSDSSNEFDIEIAMSHSCVGLHLPKPLAKDSFFSIFDLVYKEKVT